MKMSLVFMLVFLLGGCSTSSVLSGNRNPASQRDEEFMESHPEVKSVTTEVHDCLRALSKASVRVVSRTTVMRTSGSETRYFVSGVEYGCESRSCQTIGPMGDSSSDLSIDFKSCR